jgi:hypothetical protein
MAQRMRHNGAMDVSPFAERLAREFAALARTDSEDAGAVARVESAIRLTLSDVLEAAADETSRDLAPGSVEVRFDGPEAHFAVTPPPPERSSGATAGDGPPDAGEDATERITVRVSGQLKAAIEQAAGREGRSAEAWLGQLASTKVQQDSVPRTACRTGKPGRQRYTAWVR